jgi:hypothetical protein
VIPGGVLAAGRVDATREAVLTGSSVRVRNRSKVAGDGELEPGTIVLDQLGVPRALGVLEDAPAIVVFVPEQGGVRLLVARILGGAQSGGG